jgi:hypothetical protein
MIGVFDDWLIAQRYALAPGRKQAYKQYDLEEEALAAANAQFVWTRQLLEEHEIRSISDSEEERASPPRRRPNLAPHSPKRLRRTPGLAPRVKGYATREVNTTPRLGEFPVYSLPSSKPLLHLYLPPLPLLPPSLIPPLPPRFHTATA